MPYTAKGCKAYYVRQCPFQWLNRPSACLRFDHTPFDPEPDASVAEKGPGVHLDFNLTAVGDNSLVLDKVGRSTSILKTSYLYVLFP